MLVFPTLKGVVCYNQNNKIVSEIDDKGKIFISFKKEKQNFEAISLPFFRGIAYFFIGLFLFLHNALRPKSKENLISALCVFSLLLIGLIGLFLIPHFLFLELLKYNLNIWLASFLSAILRIFILLAVFLSLKLIPSLRQLFRNNMAISEQTKKINFLTFIVSTLFILNFVLSFSWSQMSFLAAFYLSMFVILLIISLNFEILTLAERKFARLKGIYKPYSLLVTVRPTSTERSITFAAIREINLMAENSERVLDENKNNIPMSVVISEVREKLKSAGIESSSEADFLIAESLNKKKSDLIFQTSVNKEEYRKITQAANKRAKHIPITKIFNRANFYGYDFYIDKNVLSPRQETELLVESVINEIGNKEKLKVLDLCTGSGCIAVVLNKKTDAKIYASDISENALEIAKKNAESHGCLIKFVLSDLFKAFKREKFDIIVSNPPYIKSKEILSLDDEVKKNDPLISLDGGEDGLYFYREIIKHAPKFLTKEGKIFFEIGYDQATSVKKLLQKDFENIKIKKDYAGLDRIVSAKLKGK